MWLFPIEESLVKPWVVAEMADRNCPAKDDRIIWQYFLRRSGRYCVPSALRCEQEVSFVNKLPILLRLFSISDDYLSPVDMMLLFHVYMLDMCVTRVKWETWLDGLDLWLQGVTRRIEEADLDLVFKVVSNHAEEYFVPTLYGAFQASSGVGNDKRRVEKFLSSRYKALSESGKPMVQAYATLETYAVQLARLTAPGRELAKEARPASGPQNLHATISFMELLLGEYVEDGKYKPPPQGVHYLLAL